MAALRKIDPNALVQIEREQQLEAALREALTADPQTIRLALGEMTAQEMRTVRAAFSWDLAKINAIISKP